MKLSEFLKPDDILPELKANDKEGVLEELAEVVCSHDPVMAKEDLVDVLMERERLGTTGIGDGVAIPHGKMHNLKQPVISFGKSIQGVDFDAMDGHPVNIFFLLIAPENLSDVHLQVLARIARILKNNAFRQRLRDALTRDDIYKTIIQFDE
jgi:PTS system nitrogen regulatory IIA component